MLAESSALIIVDVQNDFCPGGRLAVPDGDAVVPVVNSIVGLFPLAVATQDWHPVGHVSFASSHPGTKPFDSITVEGVGQTLWPEHCVQESEGAELHPGFGTGPVRVVLRKGLNKGLDSYSAFYENDRKTNTGLGHFLRGMGASDLVVCGLATDFCVRYTVLDALELGFRVTVIEDAVRGVDQPEGSVQEAIKSMKEKGARFAPARELRG